MGNFLYAIEGSDIVEGIDAWRETSVEAEDLIVDKGGEGEVIEQVGEVFPYVCIAVLSKTLIIEAIDLSDLTGFVIATEDCDALGVSNFKSNEQCDGLNRVITPIDVIACAKWLVLSQSMEFGAVLTHEKVVCIWVWPTDSEQFHQVVKLSMNITADSYRTFLETLLASWSLSKQVKGCWHTTG